jgi:hypothetical protein
MEIYCGNKLLIIKPFNNKALKSQLDGMDLSAMNEIAQRAQNFPITKDEV